jgi:predicted enzyme related to lactoylglutathione lyase
MARLLSVGPISGEDTNALPVKEIAPAVAFYQSVLRFSVVRQDATTAVLSRDDVRIGLVRDPAHDPKKAGSIAFKVDDLDALHAELLATGADVGKFGTGEWGGKKHRTFFLREDTNGYCSCFYRPV